jgi:hypothetical protein
MEKGGGVLYVVQSKKRESTRQRCQCRMRRREENNDEKNESDVMMRWKNPNETRPSRACASAAILSSLLFTHSASLSLTLVSSYRSTITTRWMKVDDGCMDWWEATKKNEKKTYKRTNVIALQFLFEYTIMESYVIEMSKL